MEIYTFNIASTMRCSQPPRGITRTSATAVAINMPNTNDANVSGTETIKPDFTNGTNASITNWARCGVIKGRFCRKLFNTDVFSEELFTQFFQCAIGLQLFHRAAEFGDGFVIAFVGNQT